MVRELVLSSEGASADLTGKRLYPGMRSLMPDKIGCVRELLLTFVTRVWPLAGMLPPVLIEISRVIERLLTEVAR